MQPIVALPLLDAELNKCDDRYTVLTEHVDRLAFILFSLFKKKGLLHSNLSASRYSDPGSLFTTGLFRECRKGIFRSSVSNPFAAIFGRRLVAPSSASMLSIHCMKRVYQAIKQQVFNTAHYSYIYSTVLVSRLQIAFNAANG